MGLTPMARQLLPVLALAFASCLLAASAAARCHTVSENDCGAANADCFEHVKWAKETGISTNPEWYPGLTSSSSFEAFQALLNSRQEWLCPAPCSPCNVTVTRAQSPFGRLFSMKIGDCVSDGAGGSVRADAEANMMGHTCTKNYYVSFAHFGNAFCSEVF